MEIVFNLRDLKIDDYDSVIELWKASGLPYRPKGRDQKERIELELEKESAIFLVVEAENNLVGVVFGTHDGRKGWINRLAVHPNYRHFGVAKLLVAEVEKRLLETGIEIMTCLIENENKESQSVFKKLGFKEWKDIAYFSKRMNPDV